MRAVIAVAVFAAAAQAAALPAGENALAIRTTLVTGNPDNGGTGGLDPTHNTSGGGNSTPGGGNSTPGGGNTTPGGGNTTPGGGNSHPGGGNSTPGGGNSTPGGGNSHPGGGNTTPGGGNTTPAGGNTTPAGGNTTPAGGNTTPAGGNTTPAGGNTTPAGGNTTPAGGADTTTDGSDGSHHGHGNGNGDYTHTYTPYVPPQGYSPPASYPSGSDLEHCPPSYSGPWGGSGSTGTQYPYPPSYPSSYGQSSNTGSSYSGGNAPSDYEVHSPSYGESVSCGKPYSWKWSGPTGSKVKLELVYGQGESDCHTYTTISDSCDNSGSYDWAPYDTIPPTGGNFGYGLRVTCLDTGKQFYSNQFCFENNDFYNKYHHEACPTAKPTPITITCESPIPSPSPCETAAPVATPCETEAPAATTPCETAVPVAPQEVANATSTEAAAPPAYTGAASGIKASFTFVSALAVLVAFAL